jgi:hypothetical protein
MQKTLVAIRNTIIETQQVSFTEIKSFFSAATPGTERSRTFQNGLSDPDFRYRPRQFGERRGKYIKVEQTPFGGSRLVLVRGYDRSGCECCVQRGRLGGVFSVQQVLANPWRRTESAGKPS